MVPLELMQREVREIFQNTSAVHTAHDLVDVSCSRPPNSRMEACVRHLRDGVSGRDEDPTAACPFVLVCDDLECVGGPQTLQKVRGTSSALNMGRDERCHCHCSLALSF